MTEQKKTPAAAEEKAPEKQPEKVAEKAPVKTEDKAPVKAKEPETREELALKIQEARDELQAELDVVQAEKEELRQKEHALQVKIDKLIDELEVKGVPTHIQNQRNIVAYQETQRRIREERAARRQRALQSIDGDVAALDGRSKLDAAMSRKRGYGNQRPNRSQKAE